MDGRLKVWNSAWGAGNTPNTKKEVVVGFTFDGVFIGDPANRLMNLIGGPSVAEPAEPEF